MFFADRVKETSTTTGTGDFTLAEAVTQFDAFSPTFATNEKFFYAIVGQTGSEPAAPRKNWVTGFRG